MGSVVLSSALEKMRKLRHRNVKKPTQGHMGGEGWHISQIKIQEAQLNWNLRHMMNRIFLEDVYPQMFYELYAYVY